MAIIKCGECGKDISDKASVCIGCGAPLSPDVVSSPAFANLEDLNGDGRVDFEDFKVAYTRLKGEPSAIPNADEISED